MRMNLSHVDAGGYLQLVNEGYNGVRIEKGKTYKWRVFLRPNGFAGKVKAYLTDAGKGISDTAQVSFNSSSAQVWKEFDYTFTAMSTSYKADLRIELNDAGVLDIDYVSLFPTDTYKGRKNGLRRDLAEFLLDMNPKFMRWPGGCVIEGFNLANAFHWKETIGAPENRRGEFNVWGYRTIWGMGYHEFLQFCEDAGMEPLYVSNIGFACTVRGCGEYVKTVKDFEKYYQDVYDAIMYANGTDPTNEWVQKRIAAGHPQPFHLKMVELGNENGTDRYTASLNYIYNKLKVDFPDITFINTLAMNDELNKKCGGDMYDPHWYESPAYFYTNVNIFDNVDRKAYPKSIYVGEYAANNNVGSGNLDAALSESAFIMSMERNSDIVKMCSYAPLFYRENYSNWACNLIWYNSEKISGRASYYIQKMFADNVPTYNICSKLYTPDQQLPYQGRIGLGTWLTSAKFRNVKVTSNSTGKVFYESDFVNDSAQWSKEVGTWTTDLGGCMVQSSTSAIGTQNFMKDLRFRDMTFEVEAMKTGGAEGFLIAFGCDDKTSNNYYRFNIGGWGNTAIALEKAGGTYGTTVGNKVSYSLQNNQWYKIKVVTTGGNQVKLYIDNELKYSYTFSSGGNAPLTGRRQMIAGYDETRKEIVVKVTNAESNDWTPEIHVNGKLNGSVQIIQLASESLMNENGFDNPKLVVPQSSSFDLPADAATSGFCYTFPKYSFSVIRIPAERSDTAMTMPEISSLVFNDTPVTLVSAKELALRKLAQYPEYSDHIQNPTFDSNANGWSGTTSSWEHGVEEYFNLKSFSLGQTVSNLPNGQYLLYMQGFYRNGNGKNEQLVYLQANDSTTRVCDLYSEDNHAFKYADNRDQANQVFQEGLGSYANVVKCNVTDGTLKINLYKKQQTGLFDWCCFDNFRLFYLGSSTSISPFVQSDIRKDSIYDLSGRKVERPCKGIFISNGKKFVSPQF